jgi:hypothetical protein
MRTTDTRTFKIIVIVIIAIMNICFYSIGYPDTGFRYAWDINPLFAIGMQLLFSIPMGAYIYFYIKNI